MRLPCDRCGKNRTPTLAINHYRIDAAHDIDKGGDNEEQQVELCAECRMDFKRFMRMK